MHKSLLSLAVTCGAVVAAVFSCQSEPANKAHGLPAADTVIGVVDTPKTTTLSYRTDPSSVRFQMENPSPWVDSVMNTLSQEDKIAQLFCVAVYPYKESNDAKMVSLLEKYKIGGIITMKGGPVSTAQRINKYQNLSEVPLLVCTDAEWGVKMRLDSVERFPYQMTLGAMDNDSLVYEMAARIAAQHKRMGIHVNFAPVIDVNNNPYNPVIGMRSFGEDKENVARKGWAYAKGLQDNNVLAIGKHWPGHGDTDVDSHIDLPVIRHDMNRLHDIEFYPFKELINQGLGGIMTTHLYIPAIDSTPNLAAGLSKKAVTDLLRNELGFDGLVFTDALNMSGVTKHFEPGDVDVRALLAGNDVLLMSPDIYTSINAVKKAVEDGTIGIETIDAKVRKILAVKAWAGLDHYQPTDLTNLHKDLNSHAAEKINQKLADAAATSLYRKTDLLPLHTDSAQPKVAVITIGGDHSNWFHRGLKMQGITYKSEYLSTSNAGSRAVSTLGKFKDYDVILINVHANGFRPKNNYGITEETMKAIEIFSKAHNTALLIFADALSLKKMKGLEDYNSVTVFYQNTRYSQQAGARMVTGKVVPTGKFPVTISDNIKAGMRAQ